jgi:selenocysteine lyase/cysteine desulfurase/tryptophan 2,3-dioxygenase
MSAPAVVSTAWWQEQFELSPGRTHLSGCSLPPRWRGIDEAMATMLQAMADDPAPWHGFEAEVELSRQRFAELVNASADQIAVLPSATVAAYQVVTAHDWAARPQMLGTEEDFPSISQLLHAQQVRGARLDFVSDPLSVDSWRRSLGDRTGLVSIPMVTYRHGACPPVAELCRLASAAGARTFVDAYQAAGVLPVDVQELGCDYLVAGASKYLLGLPGVAFLYCRDPGAATRSPELTGWMARVAPSNFDPRSVEVADTARRFEIGTPAIPAVLAVNAGLRLLNEVGVPTVYEHVSRLRERLADGARALGLPLVGFRSDQPHGAHLAFAVPDADGTAERLAAQGVSVSPRGDVVRVAMHLYNTEADIDQVLQGLAEQSTGASTSSHAQARQPHSATVALLDAWCREPDPATFPFREVRAAYLEVGKHHVPAELLSALARARSEYVGRPMPEAKDEPLLLAFLAVALDKVDQLYDYPSYVGLSLLPPPDSQDEIGEARAHRDRWLCWLMSDLLSFELAVAAGEPRPLPLLRPPLEADRTRGHLGLRTMRPALSRLGLDPVPALTNDEQAERARDFLADTQTGDTRLRIELSMLPVHTAHDEYLFIRVLQMFEVTFGQLTVDLAAAITAIAAGDIDAAESCLRSGARMLAESAPLFSLLATMQVVAFQTFRDFTEGASAIQSRGYKLMESLCRTPDQSRLDSAAYLSVPEVREAVLAGRLTVDEAYHAQCLADGLSNDQLVRLREASAEFAAEVVRWRRTHYTLAVRMLGRERTGTGYTEGTPYLAAVRDIPVFREVTAEEVLTSDAGRDSSA